MSERINREEFSDLVRRLKELAWSWRAEDLDALAADFGWQVDGRGERTATLTTPMGFSTGDVDFSAEGAVTHFSVAVCGYADDTPEGLRELQDIFTDDAEAATAVLGEPTSRIPGEDAEIRWKGAETTIRLMRDTALVTLGLARNDYLAEHDWAVSQGL
ncbi:DUF6301 family protein [Actinomadura gamaensis]|uniref:DUF6301 family protein n=1 Tax=Actinomadura gamaensis TaxID=1763541 RepID=A0ABV9UBF1_9ACTN